MNTSYRLHYAPDNASAIVRLALDELGLDYQTLLVDRRSGAQRSAAYLALNPAGRIPVLETPDGPIAETGAILLWLADRHGALAPKIDDPHRAGFLTTLFFLANTLHPDLIQCFYAHRFGPPGATDSIRAAAQRRVAGHIDLLEQTAARLPGWFCGTDPSILCFYTAFLLRWARLYPEGGAMTFDLTETPCLAGLMTRLEQRGSLRRIAQAEGLGDHPFTAPQAPNPPEGSAI